MSDGITRLGSVGVCFKGGHQVLDVCEVVGCHFLWRVLGVSVR